MAHKPVVFNCEHEMLRESIKPTNTPLGNYNLLVVKEFNAENPHGT
jgi:hypothetical protein